MPTKRDAVRKNFGGKIFYPIASYPRKDDAKKKAFQERIGGIRLARVAFQNGYWVVFTREKR